MAANLNVVVIEDDDFLRESTVYLLNQQGHVASGYFCAEDMDQKVKYSAAEIYVLDINLPGENGFQIAERLRKGQPNAGIIMFTARTATADRVKGYKQGADIYLLKPVDPAEFLAAVEALGRRIRPDDDDLLTLQLNAQLIQGPLGSQRVTASESMLLSHFISAPDHFLEHWQIMSCLFGRNDVSRASMEARIAYLRKKLVAIGAPEPTIKSVSKQGYVLMSRMVLG